MKRLVIATGNQHKLLEYRDLLGNLKLSSLADFPAMVEVEENFPDFAQNAALKADTAHQHTGQICLADDSGLEIEALNGAPGVRSKRFAPGSDEDRYREVLRLLEGHSNRNARFACAIAVAGLPIPAVLPDDLIVCNGCIVAMGYVHGNIAHGPRGPHGFGYDPIFELPDGRTVGELIPSEKQRISHRYEAARRIKSFLSTFFIDD